jgi:hypothetical protein
MQIESVVFFCRRKLRFQCFIHNRPCQLSVQNYVFANTASLVSTKDIQYSSFGSYVVILLSSNCNGIYSYSELFVCFPSKSFRKKESALFTSKISFFVLCTLSHCFLKLKRTNFLILYNF